MIDKKPNKPKRFGWFDEELQDMMPELIVTISLQIDLTSNYSGFHLFPIHFTINHVSVLNAFVGEKTPGHFLQVNFPRQISAMKVCSLLSSKLT